MSLTALRAKVSRRDFLKAAAVVGGAALGPTAGRLFAAPADRRFDLVVAGGTVFDPYGKMQAVADVGIKDGKIVEVAENLDRREAGRVLDADGLYISPGWIDLHTHIFLGHRRIAVDPDRDAGVHAGVTTVVDPGGFVSSDFNRFRSEIIEPSTTRILGFVNVSAYEGTPVHGDYSLFDQALTINTVVANRDVLKGVKVLASERHCGNLGIVPVKLAVQAARESGTRVMSHIGMAPPLIGDVLGLLDRGDIVTHCLKGFPAGMFHRNGTPVAEAWQAVRRGVRFDLGHGAGSFAWTAARHGRAAGLPLHSISTDLHRGNVNGPVWSYGRTLAKCLHLGYSLAEVVEMSTLGPARMIEEAKELGSLIPGTVADLTVFRVVEAPTVLTDSLRNSEMGGRDVEPVHCIRAGSVISELRLPPRDEPGRTATQ